MRHPHGLRAAAAAGLPAIGSAYEGGFFVGAISHTANSVATHLLIVAPRASGQSADNLAWKTSDTSTAGTDSDFNGSVNSANMNNASHPAAQYCEGLSIGGYTDWYLPALYELDIAYQNLKGTTTGNDTSFGINPYSVPARTVNRDGGTPAQTSVTAFKAGGTEAFENTAYASSTEINASSRYTVSFNDGYQAQPEKILLRRTRAFRKVAV